MHESRFHFARIAESMQTLRNELAAVLLASSDEKITDLAKDMARFDDKDASRLLTVAFVGQYNAGKSTIISALTRLPDILIDADVCTDKVTGFDWNGILLLDTPGIHAGYPDHDAITYNAIDQADLLVFVITNELFDERIGRHFRDLAFTRDKAREIMLVVNKMGQDPGTPAVKIPDIERVISPQKCENFRSVFIDALTYLDATDADSPEDKQELEELSNMGALIAGLNHFVRERGLMGRVTTPLFMIRSLAEQAAAYLSVDMPEERLALELLHRKRTQLEESHRRLRATVRGIIDRATTDIIVYGDDFAAAFNDQGTPDSARQIFTETEAAVNNRCLALKKEIEESLEHELRHVQGALEAIQAGPLAERLRERIKEARNVPVTGKRDDDRAYRGGPAETDPSTSATLAALKNVADVVGKLGKFAAEKSVGPYATALAQGSPLATAGSDLHKLVYNVGKFFGHNFRPWEAVHTAQTVATVGAGLSVFGSVFSVVMQIYDDVQQERRSSALRKMREQMRASTRTVARDIDASFWKTFDAFCRDFYEIEIDYVNQELMSISMDRTSRSKECSQFRVLSKRATQLIQDAQQLSLAHPET